MTEENTEIEKAQPKPTQISCFSANDKTSTEDSLHILYN